MLNGCAVIFSAGCALPYPFGTAQHSEQLLSALTGPESPPEIIREPSPYPTAVSTSQVAKPLPLQQTGAPPARQLDPQQLAGRLPLRFEGPEPAREQEAKPENSPLPQTAPAAPPIRLEVSPANTLANTLLTTPDKQWPVNTPLGSLNTLAAEPLNVKPAAHVTPVIETAPPQPFAPPSFLPPAQTPIEAPSPSDNTETAETLLLKLIASLQREIHERSERKELDELPALQQKLRLLQLVADETDHAVDQIEQLPPAEREAFKQLMFALTTWLSPDDAKRASLRNAKILRALHEVNERLSAVSKLDLKNLMFCEKVESFGWYTEFPRGEFTPKQQVILYVEVQNFAAEEKSTNAFETELQGSYQIYDAGGSIVDERKLPLDREVCRNYRRDYFLAYRIYLPAELAPGRYRLELTIEDLKAKKDFKGRKQGEAMIEFAIK